MIDPNNSSTSALPGSGTFTGTSTNVSLYNTITITVSADVDSAPCGLSAQFSDDGSTWTSSGTYTISGGVEKVILSTITKKYFRITYANGGGSQSSFSLQTLLSSSLKISNSLTQTTTDSDNSLNINLKSQSNEFTMCDHFDFSYGLNSNIIRTTITGSAGINQSNGTVILNAGSDSESFCTLRSFANFNAKFGQRGIIEYPAIFNGAGGANLIAGIGNSSNGYFFGVQSTTFGIFYVSNSVTIFISQSSFNIDKLDGTGNSQIVLNTSQGNIYKIIYPLLGFGNVYFYIMSQYTGDFILVHVLSNINTSQNQLIQTPGLGFFASAITTTGSGGIIILSSMDLYIEKCKIPLFCSPYSYTINGIISSVSTSLLNLNNMTVFNGIENISCVQLKSVSVYINGADAVILNFILNGVPNTTSYASVNVNSISQVDTSGSSISGGTQIFTMICSTTIIDLTDNNIILKNGDLISFVASSVSGSPISCSIAVNWIENTF